MNYKELEELQKRWKGKVCLFGAGVYGRTWGFTLLKAVGFQIDFYCDNGIAPGTVIREGVKVYSLDKLFDKSDEVFVFVVVAEKYQKDIQRQLLEHEIVNYIGLDGSCLQSVVESIVTSGDDHVLERYRQIVDDAEFCKEQFEYHMKFPLNLDKPRSFNEKIQWLKIYDRNPAYIKMADKYEAKKYVAETIGEEYIVPTLGVWNNFDEINFDLLPNQFVLKCTHDSGSIFIVDNKADFDRDKAEKLFKNYLKRNFYYSSREWIYRDMKPRIIAEPYLGKQLRDYKIYNFNGKAKMLHVDLDRYGEHTRNFYSSEWEYLDIMLLYPTNPQAQLEKPPNFERMMELAEILSKDKIFVRTDFYNENGKIYFGEMTFYPGAGYRKIMPEAMEYEVGKWIKLPYEM